MKNIINEFKEFAVKGNVIDLAVGVIIGAAFGKIVSSLVADIFTPLIGLVVGGVNFTDLKLILKPEYIDAAGNAVPAATLNYGNFLQNTFDFVIVAIAIFLMIKALNTFKKAQEKKEKKEAVAQTKQVMSKQEELLAEIRDLLKSRK
jgi:large conductance mechanosensitive channel